MGLASKLAASQGAQGGAPSGYGGAPAGGSYPPPPAAQGQQQQQRPQGGYPGQTQYQAYPGASSASQQPSPYPNQQYSSNQGYNRPPPPPPSQGYNYQQQPQQQYGQPQQQFGQSYHPQGQYQQATPGYNYGQPPSQAPQGQGQGYPPQQQGYPPQQQGYPPQQQGYPPQQGQAPPYGAGAPSQSAGPGQIASYKQTLQQAVQEKRLQAFYPPNSPILDQIAQRASSQIDRLCQQWRIPKEIGNDIVRLALYDIVLYIDDSGSMQFEEKGERIKDLQLILQRVAFAATLFDDDGVDVRFMNSDPPAQQTTGLRSEQQVDQLLNGHRFSGLTPMGTNLRKKVIDDIFLRGLRSGQMRKPLLVIVVTDGQPAGEPQTAVFDTVRDAVAEAGRSHYGPGAIAFQFAQVGNDQAAREFLGKLDSDPTVGSMVDCTSNYETESEEMARANPPVELTPDLWVVKLLLGAIDPSYDTQDEKQGSSSLGGPPGGNYGPPAQQYQQPQYGNQQQYGSQPQFGQQQNYGQPQQGGYGQGGYGQGQGQGGQGYNRPPPQSQQPPYPQQQGQGYGAPPPPPRY